MKREPNPVVATAVGRTIKPNDVPADAPPTAVLAGTDEPLGLARKAWPSIKTGAEVVFYADDLATAPGFQGGDAILGLSHLHRQRNIKRTA